ncbi:MAG: AlkZ family DNA glycosylase [Clostridia bacterium]|nr:AlkZ family DNA glycosylase [Clostridia bacterium]
MELTLRELKQWRLWAQHLTEKVPAPQAAGDLCGLQAQYGANALHSLRIRAENIAVSEFVKAWTLRGTLHLFPAKDLPLYLSHAPVDGIFDTPYGRWLYDGHCQVPRERMLFFARAVADALSDEPLPRDTLKDLCRAKGMTAEEEERVFSGWGGVIRLLAECGLLCVSAQVNRAYIRAPELPALPREQAAQELLRRYVAHYGPVTLRDMAYFFRWPQRELKDLLSRLPVQTVFCQGRAYYYLVKPEALPPLPRCVFLAGFDPLMLGYEKTENPFLPPEHLKKVFNNTGIVFPTLLLDGKVLGKWKEQDKSIALTAFETWNKTQTAAVQKTARTLWPDKPVK